MNKILIVDDDHEFRNTTLALLERQGFSCHGVKDGNSALEWLTNNQANLIITDFNMPGLGGIAFLERLKQQFQQFSPPFIILSGYLTHQNRKDAVNLGAGAILHKPFVFEELVETARRVIQDGRILEE